MSNEINYRVDSVVMRRSESNPREWVTAAIQFRELWESEADARESLEESRRMCRDTFMPLAGEGFAHDRGYGAELYAILPDGSESLLGCVQFTADDWAAEQHG